MMTMETGKKMRNKPSRSSSGRKPRLLWLMPFMPYPVMFGAATRPFYLLERLAPFFTIDLIFLDDDGKTPVPDRMNQLCRRVTPMRRDHPAAEAKWRSLLTMQSQYKAANASARLDRWLAKHANRYDVVIAEHTQLSWARIPAGPLRALNTHNLEHEMIRRTAETDNKRLRAAYRRFDAMKLRREENAAYRNFDLIATCSEREEAAIREAAPEANVFTAPNGVDVEKFSNWEGRAEDCGDIVFAGTMNYFPNEQGVEFFHREIFPEILKLRPETTVSIVGVNPKNHILALDAPNFRVHGGVPEIADYYRSAKVLAVPLLSGSGTRIKILEAAAAGAPIVTTPIGCEGIAVKDGEHCRIAEAPKDFAKACVELIENRQTAGQLSRAAQDLMRAQYDWLQSAEVLKHHIMAGLRERV